MSTSPNTMRVVIPLAVRKRGGRSRILPPDDAGADDSPEWRDQVSHVVTDAQRQKCSLWRDADRLRGSDVGTPPQRAGLGAQQPGVPGPPGHGDRYRGVQRTRGEDGGEGDRQQQCGEREEHVGDPHQDGVDESPEKPGGQADRQADDPGRVGDLYQIAFRMRPGDGRGPDAYLSRQPYFQKMERFLVHETAVHWIDTFRYLAGDPVAVYADLRRINNGTYHVNVCVFGIQHHLRKARSHRASNCKRRGVRSLLAAIVHSSS